MDPFAFAWHVDQDGYTIEPATDSEREIIKPRGRLWRLYRPLDEDGLWLLFAETCRSREGILKFVRKFGLLTNREEDSLDLFLGTARQLAAIAERLEAGDRLSATKLFADPKNGSLPLMKEAIFWVAAEPKKFELRFVPSTLRDALLHQAAEAITGNRRFRRCRNEGCPNWFRLGLSTAAEGGRRQTITARREFCSTRCRVAHARRQKREATSHA